jgi:hypothetical protein
MAVALQSRLLACTAVIVTSCAPLEEGSQSGAQLENLFLHCE